MQTEEMLPARQIDLSSADGNTETAITAIDFKPPNWGKAIEGVMKLGDSSNRLIADADDHIATTKADTVSRAAPVDAEDHHTLGKQVEPGILIETW